MSGVTVHLIVRYLPVPRLCSAGDISLHASTEQ
jgi:hypothetical protein